MQRTLRQLFVGVVTILVTLLLLGCPSPTGDDGGGSSGGNDTGDVSTDATLSDLAISEGTLSSAFAAATTSYTVSVENAVTSVTVTPTVNDSGATVTVNGNAVTSGSASGAIILSEGSNTITVVVTAEDGTTTESYTITVTRAAAGAAWTSIDLGVSGTIEANNGLVVDSSGSIYAMYRDASDDVQVVKRSGTSNAVITPSGLANGSNGLIALDPTDNEPVIMTMTESGNSLPVVRKYGGSGTTWTEEGTAELAGLFTVDGTSFKGSSTYSDMAVDSAGNVYLVLKTSSILNRTYDEKALVAKYDGTNWTRIGLLPDITSTSSDADAYVAISVDSSNNVYVGFSRDVTGETHLSAVYTYNSTDETWSLVGDSTVTANYTYDFDFTIAGDSVWVAAEYQPGGTGDYSLYAYNYDGSVWTQSGSPLATSPSEVVIVPNGNHPLAVAKTGLSSENRVDFDTFDGSSWSEAAPAIEDYYIQNTRVTVVNGVIYVSYQRKAGSASDWEFRASSYQIPD
jgi:predicted nucleic acid-binding Zn ribbon protein